MSAQHLTCPFLPDLTCHFLPELEILRLAWTKGLPGLRRGSDGQRERAAGSIRTGFLLHAEAQRLQLTTWPLNEGKGIDDYLATKAGTDPPGKRKLSPSCEQRQAVLQHFAACSPVSSLKLSWVI
jgi:hypothetical protein